MDTSAEKSLLRKLASKVGLIRKATARRLGEVGGENVVPALVGALEDRDGEVREEAARALGKRRSFQAKVALERLVDDELAPVRRAAREALAAIARAGPETRDRKSRGSSPAKAEAPGAFAEPGLQTAPPGSRSRAASAREALLVEALSGTGAVCVRTPFGFEVEIARGGRKQRVRVIFENKDDAGDDLILVQTSCGRASKKDFHWALRQNLKYHHGHLALRRSGEEEHFVFCRTLLERTTQPEELRKAVLAAAQEGDRIERALSGGRDDH